MPPVLIFLNGRCGSSWWDFADSHCCRLPLMASCHDLCFLGPLPPCQSYQIFITSGVRVLTASIQFPPCIWVISAPRTLSFLCHDDGIAMLSFPFGQGYEKCSFSEVCYGHREKLPVLIYHWLSPFWGEAPNLCTVEQLYLKVPKTVAELAQSLYPQIRRASLTGWGKDNPGGHYFPDGNYLAFAIGVLCREHL